MRGLLAGLLGIVAACGEAASPFVGGPDGRVAPAADGPIVVVPDGASGASDAGPAVGWTTLVQGSWTLAPFSEDYVCVRLTVVEDGYIAGFEPIAPPGTHHTLLTIDTGTSPDGTTLCHATVGAPRMLFGSGVGSGRLDLPDGVALKVEKGQQYLLNLHLFNATDQPLSGLSGVRGRFVPAAEVAHAAAGMLMGPLGFTVGKQLAKVDGQCTLPAGTTLVAAAPHMHQLGVHMRATAGSDVLIDEDYSFDRQIFYRLDRAFASGTTVSIECTYANDTGHEVGWGESTTAEMCFLIAIVYPANGVFELCSS